MTEPLRIFLACLASTIPVGALITFLAAATDSTFDLKDVWLMFVGSTTILLGLVLVVGSLYFLWGWAV